MFSHHNQKVEVEINNKIQREKYLNSWKLSDTLLNSWAKEYITKKLTKLI